MSRPVPIHYLRPNHAERTPTDVLVFDTETDWVDTDAAQVHRLKLWVACHDRRNDTRKRPSGTTWANGSTVDGLADVIEQHARSGVTLWAFAHNLSFDLAVCPLPDTLAGRGWTLTEFSARTDHPWFRFTRGNHRVTLVDSHSWVPTSLSELAKTSTLDKPPLPTAEDTPERWLHRCTADVALTREAVHQVLDWWEAEKLGRFTISGPACGWNAWRHRFYPGGLLVDPDPTLRDFERRAMYGGRREAFRTGCSPRSVFADVDFVNAYPTVAGGALLPQRRLQTFPGLPAEHRVWSDPELGFIAHVTVHTDTPCLPVRLEGSVLYPVGSFATIATQPEVEHARSLGAHVEVGSGVLYQLGPLLADWSTWVRASGPSPDERWAPAVQLLLKHWSRTVIGRFASRSSTSTLWGDSPEPGWHLEHGTDDATGGAVSWLDISGRRYLVRYDTEPENALPAVTAYVEALCRVQLDAGMRATGLERVVQCDTDGWLVDLHAPSGPWGAEPCRKAALFHAMPTPPGYAAPIPEHVGPMTTHVKAWFRHVDVLGPAHLWLDGQRRLSGVPRAAVENDDGTFTSVSWPRLSYQLTHASIGTYERPRAQISLRGPYGSRWVLGDGRTEAPRTAVDGRTTTVLPWAPADTERAGERPTGPQHPLLERAGVHDGNSTAA